MSNASATVTEPLFKLGEKVALVLLADMPEAEFGGVLTVGDTRYFADLWEAEPCPWTQDNQYCRSGWWYEVSGPGLNGDFSFHESFLRKIHQAGDVSFLALMGFMKDSTATQRSDALTMR
jgi:hypothetical protein